MDALRQALNATLADLGLEAATEEARAVLLWPEVVGPTIAAASRAVSVRRGELIVEARSAVWVQELTLSSGTILRKLRTRLGGRSIRRLRVRLGQMPTSGSAPTERPVASEESLELTPDEEATATALTADGDDEWGELLARVWRAERRARKRSLRRGGRVCAECGAVFRGRGQRCPSCRMDAGELASRVPPGSPGATPPWSDEPRPRGENDATPAP